MSLNLVTNAQNIKIWERRYSAGDMWHLNKINIGPQSASFKVSKQKFSLIIFYISI